VIVSTIRGGLKQPEQGVQHTRSHMLSGALMAVKRFEVGSEHARPLNFEDQLFQESKVERYYLDGVRPPSDMAKNVVGQKLSCKIPSFSSQLVRKHPDMWRLMSQQRDTEADDVHTSPALPNRM
jgi:hypothetical protein